MLAARAAKQRLAGELREVAARPADRVEMHRQPARGDRVPYRVPPGVPQRRHVVAAGDFEPADIAALGDALDLADRRVDGRGLGCWRARQSAPGAAAEIGEPVIVDAQHRAGRLIVVEPVGGAENPVKDFGLDAVAILILEPQVGVGQPADCSFSIGIKPGRGHAVGAVDLARLVLAPGRTHAVRQPERRAVLGNPFLAARAVGDIGHAVLQSGRRVRGEEVGRQPDQIDMAIGRDRLCTASPFLHFVLPKRSALTSLRALRSNLMPSSAFCGMRLPRRAARSSL